MTLRKELLAASGDSIDTFQSFFKNIFDGVSLTKKSKKTFKNSEAIDILADILQEFGTKENYLFWKNVKHLCQDGFRCFVILDQKGNHSGVTANKEAVKKATQLLENIAVLCLASVKVDGLNVTDEHLETVSLLYSSLLTFAPIAEELADTVCCLCVQWWSNDLPSKNNLCLNTLIYLFKEVLENRLSSDKSSSRLYSQIYLIQNALSCVKNHGDINFVNETSTETLENIQDLRLMLASSFLHPGFLKVKNGRKLLSNVLLLDQDLMKTVHQILVKHLSTNHCYSDAYGNIYYLAWLKANELMKKELEEYCIQNIMYRAVHVPHGKDLFIAYRKMLSSITCQNGALQVRHMLTKLYNPIIWRSLKATNPMVRANAACLLFDNFPLVNAPNEGTEDRDALLQKQFAIIEDLMIDNFYQIRNIAVTGIFNILSLYWDVIPAHVIAVQCRNLYTNLAFDTCVSVRHAVFTGTIVLLGNPCSHPLLKKLLPVIGQCIHDKSEKVRIAVWKLLLSVKQTSLIKFWDVCSIDNILAQLEVEGRVGSTLIVRLITGSFLPQNQSYEVWVERCVNFFLRNTGAARKFYLFSKDQLSTLELGDFVDVLSLFILNIVSKSSNDNGIEKNQKENSIENIAEDPQTLAGLMESVNIFWMEFSNRIKSSKSQQTVSDLREKSSQNIRELTKKIMIRLPRITHVCFQRYHDERTLNILLDLSSSLHPASMPIFSKKVLPKLKNLPEESPLSYFGMLIKCIVKWSWNLEFLQLISDWLAKPTECNLHVVKTAQESQVLSKPGKSRKKNVQFDEKTNEVARPEQAIKYLRVFLFYEENFLVVLSNESCRIMAEEILFSLQHYSFQLITCMKNDDVWKNNDTEIKFLIDCLQMQFQLLSLFYAFYQKRKEESDIKNADAYKQKLKDLIEQTGCEVIDQLKKSMHASLNISVMSATTLLNQSLLLGADIGLLTFPTAKEFLEVVFTSSFTLLQHGIPVAKEILAFLSDFSKMGLKLIDFGNFISLLLKELLETFLLLYWSNDDYERDSDQIKKESNKILNIFNDLMVQMMMFSRKNPDGFHETFRKLRSNLRSFIQNSFEYSSKYTKHFYNDLATKILSAILTDISHHKLTESLNIDHLTNLPPFSYSFLTLAFSKPAEYEYMFRFVLPAIFEDQELLSTKTEKDKDAAVKSCILLLSVLSNDGKNRISAKTCLENFEKKFENKIDESCARAYLCFTG